MRSRHVKRSPAPLLVGAAVLVLGLLAGAVFLLGEDGPGGPPESPPIVLGDRDETPPSMPLPDATLAPEAIERLLPESTQAVGVGGLVTQAVDPEQPRGSIAGYAVDEQGRPVEGALVRVSPGHPIANMSVTVVRDFLPMQATTGADGTFTLADVPVSKNYLLAAEHDAFAPALLQGVAVRADQTTGGARLVLRLGATISGIVTTLAEQPIAEARVELYDTVADARLKAQDRLPIKIVFTDPRGEFAFTNVSITSFKVRAQAPSFETQAIMISSALKAATENQHLTFRLAPGRELAGRVVDDDNRGVAGVRIEANALKRDYQGNAVATSDDGGYFLLDGVSTEHVYQVRATARGFSDATLASVNVLDGNLLIQMHRRLAVEGWVANADGKPTPRFGLALLRVVAGNSPAMMNDVRDFNDDAGRFLFDDLEPGTWAFEARAPGFAPSRSGPVEVRRDLPLPSVQITVVKGGTLAGVVTTADGQPVAKALVALNENDFVDTPLHTIFDSMAPSAEKKVQTRTNAEGRYELTHVAPGVYQVAVKHHLAAPFALNDVTVVDDDLGTNPELDIMLPVPASVAGTAYDNNRQAQAFMRVQINQSNGYSESVVTDDAGRFLFDNLVGGEYALSLFPDQQDDQPVNPLLKLMLAQQSRKVIRVADGQVLAGVELYLPASP